MHAFIHTFIHTFIYTQEGITNPTPLLHFFGHNSTPREKVELYTALAQQLATSVKARMDADLDARSSGCIIDTCGWVDTQGLKVIEKFVEYFEVDIILVMNNDKVFAALSRLSNAKMTVVKLPSSGGIVRRVSFYVIFVKFLCHICYSKFVCMRILYVFMCLCAYVYICIRLYKCMRICVLIV
jgi:hypothetical protein